MAVITARIPVASSQDIVKARRAARKLAGELQFTPVDRTLIVSAVSELARNMVRYAGQGQIRLYRSDRAGSAGLVITAIDHGPGIGDVRQALQEGSAPTRVLGLGLPGVKRIMDDLKIVSSASQGTTVTVKKWKPL